MEHHVSHPGAGIALLPGRLTRLRTQQLKTRAELAKAAGLSLSAVAKIENGVRRPRIGTLQRLCEVLGCQPADLTDEDIP